MKKQKPNKGDYSYPVYARKRVIFCTILYFAISIAVFVTGWISTGTKENLLTIVAVLGLLPSSKSLVSVIMYLRIPAFSRTFYEAFSHHIKTVKAIYSMYLTSYKKNFAINCFAVRGANLVGFTEFDTCDTDACEKHIKEMLNQNALKGITVKIFRERQKFMDRTAQLEALEPNGKEDEILALLCDISL